ncbi:hypothetical protein AUJ29_01975 [Candidatus Kuenenbacteria bacterium CG1_02_38_13]|uniref:Nudix hydrolase domain-containing protein n=1 Tax=Candidatus Kuenenbacteria bacterium CG1_02_38_13 TaxID=1805235 RepID=A0A1J4U2P3_9BACT|nr:MAG: hypothetical protein AUJ29_01975 [Candidatus Kuenenbacteria bacterium CG1_02_38_13]
MKMKNKPVPIISALLIKKMSGKIKLFLQERWKPQVSPNYLGLLEIPAGGIDAYENVYLALKREVYEECGLKIIRIIDDYRGVILKPSKSDAVFVFRPFVCQQMLKTEGGLPWIGFVFVCEVAGKIKMNKKEAGNPQWVSIDELKILLEKHPKKFFPLQLPVLKYFVEKFYEKI